MPKLYNSPIIECTDMQTEMLEYAMSNTMKGIKHLKNEMDLAFLLRVKFEHKYGLYWHCLVGMHFQGEILHEADCYLYMTLGKMKVLLFKSG
ncbi:hypothetical protein WDU94_013538 [Cyamophila willieti]